MGKLARRYGSGNQTFVVPLNSAVKINLCNTGAVAEDYMVEIKSTSGVLAPYSSGTLGVNSDCLTLDAIHVQIGESVVVTASSNITTNLSLLQETTLASGSLTRADITHAGDGVLTQFLLPANAPANWIGEVFCHIDGFRVHPNDLTLNATNDALIFPFPPYNGAEILIELWKTEA